MKYTPNSKSKKFAVMRKTIVKSLMTLLATMTCLSSYAEIKESAYKLATPEGWTYDGKEHPLFSFERISYDEKTQGLHMWYFEDGNRHGPNGDITFSDVIEEKDAKTYTVKYYIYGYPTLSGFTGGHTYVDLGLKSGLLWATYNIGADSYFGHGQYFKWAETTGVDAYPAVTGDYDYKYLGADGEPTKYFGKGDISNYTVDYEKLQPTDDAATVNWGNDWRMPTNDDWDELIDACTWLWYEDYHNSGISGFVGTSKKNGNEIFFPYDPAFSQYTQFEMWSSSFSPRCPGAPTFCNQGCAMHFGWEEKTDENNINRWPYGRHQYKPIRAVTTKSGTEYAGSFEVTVEPKKVTCRRLDPATQKYSGKSSICPNFKTYSGCDLQAGETIKWKAEDEKGNKYDEDNCPSLPGKYTIKQYVEGDTKGNYIFDDVTFEITKGACKLSNYPSPIGKDQTYDGKEHEPCVPAGVESFPGEWRYYTVVSGTVFDYKDISNYSNKLTKVSAVGNYRTYYAFVPEESDLYEIYFPEGSFPFNIVEPENIELTFEYDKYSTIEYNGEEQYPAYTLKDKDGNVVNIKLEFDVTDDDGKPVKPVNGPKWYTATPKLPSQYADKYTIVNNDPFTYRISYKLITDSNAEEHGITLPSYKDVNIEYDGEYHLLVNPGISKTLEGEWTYGPSQGHDASEFELINGLPYGKKAIFNYGKYEYSLTYHFKSTDGNYQTWGSPTNVPGDHPSIKPATIHIKNESIEPIVYTGEDIRPTLTSANFDGIVKGEDITAEFVMPDNENKNGDTQLKGDNITPKPGYQGNTRYCAINAGEYSTIMSSITISGDDADNYTKDPSEVVKFEIIPAELTLALDPNTSKYTGEVIKTPEVKIISGLADKDKEWIKATAKLAAGDKGIDEGTHTFNITLEVVDGAEDVHLYNYNYASTLDYIITEGDKVEPLILFDFKGWTYGDTPTKEELQSNPSGGDESYSYYYDEACETPTDTKSGAVKAGGQPKNAGDYYIKVDVAAKGQYKATSAVKAFTIEKATLKPGVDFIAPVAAGEVEYNGEFIPICTEGKTSKVEGSFLYRGLNSKAHEKPDSFKDVKEYPFHWLFTPYDNNYDTYESELCTLKITQKSLKVTWDQSDNLTYKAGKFNPQPTFVCADADKESFSKVKATLKKGDDDYNVGTFTMEIDLDDLKENVSGFENNYKYNSDDLTKTFTIKPFECEVSWSSGTAVYPTPTKGCSGAPKELSLKVSKIIDEEGGISYNDLSKFKGEPGDYIVEAVADVENPANYKLTNDNYKFTIAPVEVTVKDKPQPRKEKEYDGAEHDLFTTKGEAGSIEGHFEYALNDGAWSTDMPQIKDADTYTARSRFVPDDEKYSPVVFDNAEVVILQHPVKILWYGLELVPKNGYPTEDEFFAIFQNNQIFEDDKEYVSIYIEGRNKLEVGDYPVTATLVPSEKGGVVYKNYTILNSEETLKIRKAIEVAIPNYSKLPLTYNGEDQDLTPAIEAPDGCKVEYAYRKPGQSSPSSDDYSEAIPAFSQADKYILHIRCVPLEEKANTYGTYLYAVEREIAKKQLTVTWDENKSLPFTGDFQTPHAKLDYAEADKTEFEENKVYKITSSSDGKSVGAHTVTLDLSKVSEATLANYTLGDLSTDYEITAVDYDYTAPTAIKPLTYTGVSQSLVKAGVPGTEVPGDFYYYVTTSSSKKPAFEDFKTDASLKAKNAGTYYVHYYYQPTGSLEATEPAFVKVEIAKAQLTLTWDESPLPFTNKLQYPEYNLKGFVSNELTKVTKTISPAEGYDCIKVGPQKAELVITEIEEGVLDNYIKPTNLIGSYEITAVDYDYTAPTAIKPLTYTGVSQSLVKAGVPGTEVPGEFYYYVTTSSSKKPALEDFKTDASLKAKNAGTYYVHYYYQPTGSLEATEPAFVKVEIAKAKVEVVWDNQTPYEYKEGESQAPTATANDVDGKTFDLEVNFSGDGDGIEPGDYTATASLPANYKINYELTGKTSVKFSIVDPVIPFEYVLTQNNYVVGQQPSTPSLNADKEFEYAYYIDAECKTKTDSENGGAVSEGAAPKVKGVYYVKAVIAGEDATPVAKFNVLASPITVGSKSLTLTYNGKDQAVTTKAEASIDGKFTYGANLPNKPQLTDDQYSETIPTFKDVVNQINVFVRFTTEDETYKEFSPLMMYTISKIKPATIRIVDWEDTELVYDPNKKQLPKPVIKVVEVVEDGEKLVDVYDDVELTLNSEEDTEPQTYRVKATLDTKYKNYVLENTNTETKFTIIDNELDFTAPVASPFTYNGKSDYLVKPGEPGTKVPGDFYYFVTTSSSKTPALEEFKTNESLKAKNAGKYYVHYYYKPTDDKLEATEPKSIEVEIAKKEVSIVWPKTIEFELADVKEGIDWSNVTFDPEAAPIDDDKVTIVVEPTDVPKAGNYTATASLKSEVEGAEKNYDLKNYTHSFIVKDEDTPEPLKPTLTISDWTYGGKPSLIEVTNICDAEPEIVYYTDEDCKTKTTTDANGAEGEGGAPTFAGDYWIVATVEQNGSCAGGTVKDKFTIKKAVLTIKWNKPTTSPYTYNGKSFVPGVEITAGKVGTDDVTVSAEGAQINRGDDYVATAKLDGVSAKNYTIVENATTTFSIQPRTVSIHWLENEPTYGYDKEPHFPSFTPDGILEEDIANVVVVKDIDTEKTEIGDYTAKVVLSGSEEAVNNYVIPVAQESMPYHIVDEGSVEFIEPKAFVDPLTYNGEYQKLIMAGTSVKGKFWYALGDGEFFVDSIPVAKNANLDGYIVKYKFVPTNGDAEKTGKIIVPIKKYLINASIWNKTEFVYTGTAWKPTANVKPFRVSFDDELDVIVEGEAIDCDSNEEVTATLSGADANNYELAESQKTTIVKIDKSDYILKTDPVDPKLVYDGEIHELVTAGVVNASYPGKFTYSINDGEFTDTIPMGRDAKDYVVAYQFTPDNHCYNTPKPGIVNVNIAKKDPKISWGTTTFIYNGNEQTPKPVLTDKLPNEDVDVKIVEIINAPAINPDKYTAIVELTGADSKNYILSVANSSQEFTITKKGIYKPNIGQTEFTYNSDITHSFVKNDGSYSITVNGKTIIGDAEAKEPGDYLVSIVPAFGYTWSDGSVSAIEQTFKVKRIKIDAPARDMRDFYFDGSTQTYNLATNSAYSISGNSQKYVGIHDVVVSLKDINHYEWNDGSVVEKHYDFEIKKATVKLPTADSVLVYIYDGTEKRFDITYDKIGSILADSNDVGTEVGKYVRTVVLNMDEKGGYTWSNLKTDTIRFPFEIKPQPVIEPRVDTTYFKYDGNEHQFKILGDTANPSRYSISMDVESATDPDTFYATCSLYDKKNYIWDHQENSDDIEIKFIIGDGKIDRPDIAKQKIYTGKPVVFVPTNSTYNVELKDYDGNVVEEAVEVGDYEVTVTPKNGFTWSDGSRGSVVEYVAIIAREVEKPVIPEVLTYDGTEKFNIPESEFYDITGDKTGIEPGMYKATLTLKPNYKWNDQTVSPYDINVKIDKIMLIIPEYDNTEFVYTGEEQTYKIVVNEEICKVVGNKQTNAGNYNVIVSISSKYHRWSDNTETARSYPFIIKRASVNVPVVAKNTFEYDGSEHKFEIAESDKYIISPEHKSETEVGKYMRTVSLVDTSNHCWSDGSVKDKEIEFNIVAATIDIPSFVKESEYTGKPIEFVPEGLGYTVTNRVKTDVGSYVVTVSLKKGYEWKVGGVLDIVDTCVITPLYIEKPNVKDATFTYDGTYHSFGFKPNDGYTFVGDTAGKEPGIYQVTVKLNPNYLWDGDTNEDETFTFIISKQDVPVPLANGSKFIYNGEEQTYEIVIPEDSLFDVINNVQTNAGTYTVKAVLKDHLHYQWSDMTIADKTFDFIIAKAKVLLPTAPTTNFIFDGKEKQLVVDDSKLYDVADSNKVATNTGKYIRTATLTDSLNYTWIDGTTSYKSIIFTIGDGTLEDLTIQHEYEYTGDTIVFVPKDAAYTVVNGFGINAGTYIVEVTPNAGYRWSDSTKTKRVDTVVIKPIVVEKPQLILEYTYNKKIIDFNVPVNPAYEIVGATYGLEIGNYKVTLNLLPNHVWSDGTSEAFDYNFSINKILVPIPPIDSTVYVYNGKRQTYNFEKSPYYNVLGNVQTYAGSYEISVLLTDFAHTMWSDSTVEVKTYNFEIGRAKVENPKAVQSTFAYDGKPKNFLVQENSRYEVLSNNSTQTEVGTYERSVMLKDTLNYTWADGSVTDKTVIFEIVSGVIEVPVIETEYVYNGTEITFVPENPAYTVENGVKVNAGDYSVVVTLNTGYVWSDSTTGPKLYDVVIKQRPIAKPEFPATNIYTYDDTIRGVDIPHSDGYVVTGTTQTKEPGTYDVVVSLDPNYIWMDNTTDDLKYQYIIKRIAVEIPAVSDSVFKYTGTDVTYPIVDTVDYYVVKGHHQTTAGLHFITVTLTDTLHYEWSDGTTMYKIYEFLIGKFKVDYPRAVIDSFVYDGNIKLFDIVPNKNYVVGKINPAGIQIGEYERTVSLIDTANFLWPDGSVDDKIVKFYINKNIIPSILVPTEVTYTGDTLILVPQSPAYSLVNSLALNAGSYDVIIIPSDGYTWPDTTTNSRILTITVKPKMVKIPDAVADTFKYNSMPQTYNISIPKDSLFTVTQNIQTEVGNYNAVVSLKDSLNYCWTDSTNGSKLYPFVIENSNFILGPITQSQDMGMEATPGHLVVFDVELEGRVYKYWVRCDSCPAFNTDTVLIKTASFDAFDVMIPDTVKPGVYTLDVYLMSGSLIKSEKVTLRVNYPASDIYVVWGDVLTIDNTSNLFHTYQWYKNGEVIPGATRQYYQEKNGLDGYYMCLVNNEVFVGPAFFHIDKPLWIKAVGGEKMLTIEVVGNIPAGTNVEVCKTNGVQIKTEPAKPYIQYTDIPNDVYIVRLVGSDQSVKVLVK